LTLTFNHQTTDETAASGEDKPKQKYYDERKPFADIERDNEKFKNYYKVRQTILGLKT
jgi:multisite-specific tRNA:(cytosine-C5)-methyltransferase